MSRVRSASVTCGSRPPTSRSASARSDARRCWSWSRALTVDYREDAALRSAADLIAGHWRLLTELGAVPRVLVWDNEGAVGSWRSGGP